MATKTKKPELVKEEVKTEEKPVKKRTYGELFDLQAVLNKVGQLPGLITDENGNSKLYPECKKAIARNIRRIDIELEDIRGLSKPTDQMKKYDDERIKLNKDMSLKDPSGQPVMKKGSNGQENFITDPKKQKEFNEKYDLLKKKYAKEVKEIEALNEKFQEYLKREINSDMPELESFTEDQTHPGITANEVAYLMEWGIILESE